MGIVCVPDCTVVVPPEVPAAVPAKPPSPMVNCMVLPGVNPVRNLITVPPAPPPPLVVPDPAPPPAPVAITFNFVTPAGMVNVDVPVEVDWYISEYDGLEEVREKHRTWS